MTRDEFTNLKIGDVVELLERDFTTRTGKYITVFARSKDGHRVYFLSSVSGRRRSIDNWERVAFPQTKQ